MAMLCFNTACTIAAANIPAEQAQQVLAAAAACIRYVSGGIVHAVQHTSLSQQQQYGKATPSSHYLPVTLTSTHSLQLAKDHWLSCRGDDVAG
jgi:hypothetical protein